MTRLINRAPVNERMDESSQSTWLSHFPETIHKLVPLKDQLLGDIDISFIREPIAYQLQKSIEYFFNCDFKAGLTFSKVVLDITWEKLNTGYWKDVNINWRYLYYQMSLMKALCECAIIRTSQGKSYAEAIKTCDMGLLMGAPGKENLLTKIVKELHVLQNSVLLDEERSKRKHELDDEKCECDLKNTKSPKHCHNICGDIDTVDLSNATMIERVHCPSLEQFKKNYMDRGLPVIIEGAIDYWPALSTNIWTLDYIRKIAGHRTVPIEIGSKYTEENWSQSLMTISEFIDKHITPSGGGNIGYLAQHQLFDQIPELEKDISVPTYCCLGEKDEVDVNAWFGPRGTVSPLHQDPKHNILAQVVGSKYIKMYSVDQSEFVYPFEGEMMNNTSQVDVENPDLDKFPQFKQANAVECVLKEGELLYIPKKYWHYLRSLSVSFSVSFWWE